MKWFKAQATGKVATISIDRIISSDWTPEWIVDFFGEQSARDFIEAVDALGELDEINLNINSPGGDVYSGIRIANYLMEHPAPVNIRVGAMAGSIASIILLAGDTRTFGQGSRVMIHKPSIGLQGFYNEVDLETHRTRLKEIEDDLVAIYTSRTGQTEAKIREMLSQGDTYLDADQALEMGFATAKDEQLPVAACQDQELFNLQSKLHSLQSRFQALETEKQALEKKLEQPAAATPDEIVSACTQAKLENLALALIKEKPTASLLQERLQMAAQVRDLAKASDLDEQPLLQNLGDPIQLLRTAITEAQAQADPDVNGHLKTSPPAGRTPNAKSIYAQLNGQIQ